MLTTALDYANRKWLVLPLKKQAKEPAIGNGFYGATGNPATLKRWFGNSFPYNIGVRTGLPSGLLVLDIDGETGAASLRTLGVLPETLQSTTGRGTHHWFAIDREVSSRLGIAPGVDIKADGGYVAAPPSIHPNGKEYRWANDLPAAPAPDWLIQLAVRRAPPPSAPPAPPTSPSPPRSPQHGPSGFFASSAAYGMAALHYEIDGLASASSGTRNCALNKAAFSLHQLVAGGELAGDVVERGLLYGAQRNGLIGEDGERAVRATIRSGANAGLRHPRDRNGRR